MAKSPHVLLADSAEINSIRVHLQAGAINNAPLDTLKYNDTFDILLQPPAGAGFSYSWIDFSTLSSSGYTPFNISGLAPCCVPLSARPLAHQILTKNSPPFANDGIDPSSWRPQGAYPHGSVMGFCNLTSGTASVTWYKDIHIITSAEGAGQSQMMGINMTGSSTSSTSASPALSFAGRSCFCR